MAEQAGTQTSAAGAAGTQAAGQTAGQTPPAQTTEQQPAVAAPEMTAEELKAELAAAKVRLGESNRENASWRLKIAGYETAEQKRKEAEMTEAQKLQAQLEKANKERDEALSTVQQHAKRRAFEKAARSAKLNWANDDALEDGFRLADLSAVKVNGETVEGMDAVVKTLAAAKPYLFKAASDESPNVNATTGKPAGQRTGLLPAEAQELAAIYGIKPEFLPVNTTQAQGR